MSLVRLLPGLKLFRWEDRELEQVDPAHFSIEWINDRPVYYYLYGGKANVCQARHIKKAAATFLTRWRQAKGIDVYKGRKRGRKPLFNTILL
jgi:hypothetical protein